MARFRSMKRLSLAVVSLAVAAACTQAITFTPPEDAQAPLFEVEAVNEAWGPHWAGFYVDGEGHVYSWDRDGMRQPALAGDELTPAQLAEKYAAGKTLVKTLTAGEVVAHYQQAGIAARTGLTDPLSMCADAGVTRFSAWVFNADDGKYHRVLLHQRGDLLDAATRANPGEVGCDPYAD
jgi:hypothetical protein